MMTVANLFIALFSTTSTTSKIVHLFLLNLWFNITFYRDSNSIPDSGWKLIPYHHESFLSESPSVYRSLHSNVTHMFAKQIRDDDVGDDIQVDPLRLKSLVEKDHLRRKLPLWRQPFQWMSDIRGTKLEMPFAILFFLFVGPSLVLTNRYLLREGGVNKEDSNITSVNTKHTFPYPMFISGLGVLFTSVFAHISVDVIGFLSIDRSKVNRSFWVKSIFPVGLCQAATLAFGNGAYLYLSVSFIQMLKAGTPVLVMALLYCLNIEKISKRVGASIIIMALGSCVTTIAEPDGSIFGIFIMLLSEVSEAGRCVITQFVLVNSKFTLSEGMYYLSTSSALCLMMFSVFSELPSMIQSGDWKIFIENPVGLLLSGSLGILVNFSSFWLIQTSSSLFAKLLTMIRSSVLVLWGVVAYDDQVSYLEAFGYILTVAAFIWYSQLKQQEAELKQQKTIHEERLRSSKLLHV